MPCRLWFLPSGEKFSVFLTLFLILRIFHPALLKTGKKNSLYLVSYGFVLAVFNALWTISVGINGAAVSTVLVYTSAVFSAVLGWLFLKEGMSRIKLLAIFVSMAGCALVSNLTPGAISSIMPLGVAIGLAAGLAYAVYTLMGRTASLKGMNSWGTLCWIFGIAAVFMLIFTLILPQKQTDGMPILSRLFWLGKSAPGWLVLFTLAAVPTLAGYGLYNLSLSYLPSAVVNLIATSEPAFTAVLAFLVLNERLSTPQITGSTLLVAAVALLRLRRVKKNSRRLRLFRF